ncbi:hypothetical protein [Bradyrhizobium sp. 2S1]|uniref:hypothetical protein n=1 Tax=Bradyrhizobium sp. 2S1 TaxID=1404429 RepID=UPI00140E4C33|nr:hypothetical protein [Bradyrhizobium sp. 2S1]MCK7669112.1 hypothetical protein [Bradyrhizobium sp. 2S1]
MVSTHSVNFDSATRQKVVPHTSQGLWEIAYNDFVYAETMLQATRTNPDATPADIARRESDVRARKAICNALNFLITNKEDVDAVIDAKTRKKAP